MQLSARAADGMLEAMRSVCVALLLVGCSDPPAPPPEPEEPPRAERAAEEPVVDEEEPAPEPPALSDSDLDAMDEPALEAACFAGSRAACDRLGH